MMRWKRLNDIRIKLIQKKNREELIEREQQLYHVLQREAERRSREYLPPFSKCQEQDDE